MGAIYTILVIALAIFSIYSLISHAGNHGELKKRHAEVMSGLTPSRYIHNTEIQKFKDVFKKDLPETTQVYKHRGPVSYISIEINHSEQKEFSIGGVRIHPRVYIVLGKKKIGMKLDDYLPDDQIVNEHLNKLKKQFDDGEITEENLETELKLIEEEHMSHDFEFIFLKEENVDKQYAYLISISDWKLIDCLQT